MSTPLQNIIPQTDATADTAPKMAQIHAALKPSLMVTLAETISRETATLDKYFREKGGPQPGFDENSLLSYPNLPEEIEVARHELLRATSDLKDLVAGADEKIRWRAFDYMDLCSLNATIRRDFLSAVPLNGTATFAEIAKATSTPEADVRRLIYHSITNRIFREVSPGVICHTAASRILVEDPVLRSWVNMNIEEILPASTHLLSAIEKYPSSESMSQAAFCLANGTENIEPLYATLGKDPRRAKRFGQAMSSLSHGKGYEVKYLVDWYDWGRLDERKGTVVDVGGSHGFVCVDIGKKFHNVKFVVQDLPKMIQSAPKIEGELGERITFMEHDFNTVQPVKGADVYLFRWILHNQPTPNALVLLRSLIPSLKHGSRILINDHVLSSSSLSSTYSLWDEKIIRSMDLVVNTLLNAMERTEEDFEKLFKEASEGFRFLGVTRPKGCRMGILEAVWEGEDFGGMGGEGGNAGK